VSRGDDAFEGLSGRRSDASLATVGPMDRCEECGFTYDPGEADGAGPSIVGAAAEMASMLREGGSGVTRRAWEDTWSPLEYGCHVRDVLLVQRERVLAARRVDRPSPEPMGRAERAVHDGYADQDAEAVARQLGDAASMFANVLGRLGPDDWERTMTYNYPTRRERSLRWVAVHTLHEVRHHLLDVRRQLT
jgi:DinB superfamily